MSNTALTKNDAARRPVIAITGGEPAGIGYEISLRAAWELRDEAECILIGDATQLAETADALDPAIILLTERSDAERNALTVVDCPLTAKTTPGRPDAANGRQVLRTLDIAIEGAQAGRFDAVVTAPLQKSAINDAGVPFSGHTEYFAQKTGAPQVVMMLAGGEGENYMRVALATTHLPLKDVPAAITFDSLGRVIGVIDRDLKEKFGIEKPRILVAGLNPHAGEGGYLGMEEIETITPALKAAQAKGIDVTGPYPADTLFQPKYLSRADCVLAMYHDQGLPVLKHASFGRGVNITLGLPIVRVSVDHGTALDVAAQGVGHADHRSMIEAIRAAARMAAARRTAAS